MGVLHSSISAMLLFCFVVVVSNASSLIFVNFPSFLVKIFLKTAHVSDAEKNQRKALILLTAESETRGIRVPWWQAWRRTSISLNPLKGWQTQGSQGTVASPTLTLSGELDPAQPWSMLYFASVRFFYRERQWKDQSGRTSREKWNARGVVPPALEKKSSSYQHIPQGTL